METRPIIRDEYLNATRSVETAVEEWAGSECVCAWFILVRYSRVGFGILRLINMQGVRLSAKSLNKVNYFAFESILHEWMKIVNGNYTLADLFCYVVRETLGFLVEP